MTRRVVTVLALAVGGVGACVYAQDSHPDHIEASGGKAVADVSSAVPMPPDEFNTQMMEATFKIEGLAANGSGTTTGTCFILAEPYKNDPTRGFYVLITAGHVLEEMAGGEAVLHLRTRNSAGAYAPLPWKIAIRNGATPLWIRHPAPDIDIAVMCVKVATESYFNKCPPLTTGLLATEQVLAQLELHPGDDLGCLGFPYGLGFHNAAFPILRSGRIASYPILPLAESRGILLDSHIFPGNSGGPVYLVQATRSMNSGFSIGKYLAIVGLVVSKHFAPPNGKGESLELGSVIHAQFIREVIQKLSPP